MSNEITSGRPHERIWPKRLPRHLAVPATSLYFNLEVSARRFPQKAACIFFGEAMTYAALHQQAEAIAGWLQHAKVKKGDRVALYMQNCPQFMAAFYGILRADAVVVPVNPMNKAAEISRCLIDAAARVAICTADGAQELAAAHALMPAGEGLSHVLVARFTDAMPQGPIDAELAPPAAIEAWLRFDPPLPEPACGIQFVRWSDALAERHAPDAHTSGPDDMAVLPYTSGTTGQPRGCIHTHATVMTNTVGNQWMQRGAETVLLGALPMFHITGLVNAVCEAVYSGSTVILLPRWQRELAGRLISRYRVTHFSCIPTMIIDLFGSPEYQRFDLSSLKFLSGGGAAMPQAVAERLLQEFGVVFAEGYGLTETCAVTHCNPPERAKQQCLGIPVFSVDSRVVHPDTLEEVQPGEVGEIVTHGPQLFKGYWNQPEATAAAFVEIDGRPFFRTGDLGRMDEEGYFFLVDRLKRMINASGFKVWPAEVEAMLYKHPVVQEACIISAKDSYRGETVKAVVVLRAEARGKTSAEDITCWAREHMAAYKVPQIVQFVDALPKSASGKVMWRLLQEQQNA